MADTSYHTELVRKFENSAQVTQPSRDEATGARKYYNGEQLTATQIKTLNRRKQPIVIENLIRPKIDYLCGLERQSRTDPKAYHRNAADEDDANAATDALRYVTDDQDFPIKRSGVFQDMLVEGYGGVEVGHQQTRGGIDPKLTQIEWSRLFYDPYSRRPDFSDAEYLGYITWMGVAQAKRRWKDKASVIEQTATNTSSTNGSFDDKPTDAMWFSPTDRRICVVTIYDKSSGEWERCVYTRGGELEECAPSPYLDDEGKPDCALIFQSAYVDGDNDRYGIVRDYKTLQDEVNKRRSKFLHLTNTRQVRVSPNTGLSAAEAAKQLQDPAGVIMAEAGEVEIIGTGDMAAGHFNLLAEAKDAIKSVGPNATMQGKSGQDQSGRAILALQQGGMTEMAPLMDGLHHFNVRVYRAIWNRIRQFWTGERWVRVTDEEQNVRFVGLNVTKGALAARKLEDAVKEGKIDQPTAQQYAMQLMQDPSMQQPANVLGELDVDISIDETPDTPTLQIEQFDQLTKLAPVTPPAYLPVLFEMLIESSTIRNKDKLRKAMDEAKMAPPDPAQEQMQQIAMAAEGAKVEKTQSETAENYAQIEKMQADVMTGAMQAGYQTGAAEQPF